MNGNKNAVTHKKSKIWPNSLGSFVSQCPTTQTSQYCQLLGWFWHDWICIQQIFLLSLQVCAAAIYFLKVTPTHTDGFSSSCEFLKERWTRFWTSGDSPQHLLSVLHSTMTLPCTCELQRYHHQAIHDSYSNSDNECDSATTNNKSEDGSTTGKQGWCEYLQNSPLITWLRYCTRWTVHDTQWCKNWTELLTLNERK